MLVVKMNEVLQRVDVAQGDRTRRIEPFPVIERVAVVTQDRRPPKQLASPTKGRRHIVRQYGFRRQADLVHVRRCQEAEANVVQAQLPQRFLGPIARIGERPLGQPQPANQFAEPGVFKQARQIAPEFVENRQRRVVGKLLERISLG